jgi:hypothetical protein
VGFHAHVALIDGADPLLFNLKHPAILFPSTRKVTFPATLREIVNVVRTPLEGEFE